MKNDNQNIVASFWSSRPKTPVLLICLFETLGLLLIPSAIFSEEASAIGVWYQIYIGLTPLMTIAIIYLLWRMSKKGIVVYLAAYLIHNLIALIAGNWTIGVLIIPVIGVILILLGFKRFQNNHRENKTLKVRLSYNKEALKDPGVTVVESPAEIGITLKELLG